MKQLILCLVCLLLGCFATLQFAPSADDQEAANESSQPDRSDSNLPDVEQAVLELKKQLREKEAELETLGSELAQAEYLLSGHQDLIEAEEPEPPANPFTDNVTTMAVEMMVTANQEQLEKFKRTLNLTPEQITALESFYEEEAKQHAWMMQQMFAGKAIEDLQGELVESVEGREHFSVSMLLKEILTPEQLATHEANKEKEALEEKEAMAYSQLSQIQQQLLLDEDQKDAVFAIFYEAEHEIDSEEWESLGISHDDPDFITKYQQANNERLLEALSEVLTEEQLELQRKKLESEVEMQRKSLQLFGGGFFGGSGEE